MGVVTQFLNLVKPEGAEKHSRLTYNQNLDKIDNNAVLMAFGSATLNNTFWDFTSSRFTKIYSPKQSEGLVTAEFIGILKDNFTLTVPGNNTPGQEIGAVVPVGFRPKRSIGYVSEGVIAGGGRGDNLQMQIVGGVVSLRSTGSAYTLPQSNGSYQLRWVVTYGWDGNG